MIVGYLFATWGVNKCINPVVYFQNLVTKDAYTVEVAQTEKEISIMLSENMKKDSYLSVHVVDSKEYSMKVVLKEYSGEKEINQKEYSLERGWNKIKLENEGVDRVAFVSKKLTENDVHINKTWHAGVPKIDWLKTIEVLMTFWALALFWESVQFIKKKYTYN